MSELVEELLIELEPESKEEINNMDLSQATKELIGSKKIYVWLHLRRKFLQDGRCQNSTYKGRSKNVTV